jgi:hypothetical protein
MHVCMYAHTVVRIILKCISTLHLEIQSLECIQICIIKPRRRNLSVHNGNQQIQIFWKQKIELSKSVFQTMYNLSRDRDETKGKDLNLQNGVFIPASFEPRVRRRRKGSSGRVRRRTGRMACRRNRLFCSTFGTSCCCCSRSSGRSPHTRLCSSRGQSFTR